METPQRVVRAVVPEATRPRPSRRRAEKRDDSRWLLTLVLAVAGGLALIVVAATAAYFAFRPRGNGAKDSVAAKKPSTKSERPTVPVRKANVPAPVFRPPSDPPTPRPDVDPAAVAANGGDLPRVPTEAGTAIDLIPLIDPARDVVHGEWRIEDGKLRCLSMHFVPKIQIPFVPPEEYDVEIAFEQPKLRNPVCVVLPNDGASFAFQVGGARGHYGFTFDESRFDNPKSGADAKLVRTDFLHTLLVRVRRDRVEALLDGRALAAYSGDRRRLKATHWHKLRDPRVLAVGCDDPTTFHAVRLTEVAGRGTKVRE